MSQIEIHRPKDRAEWLQLRARDVTSSDVSALFGLSPYVTPFEYFHRKREAIVIDEENPSEFVKWGARLEAAIAHGVAEDNGWDIRPFKEYLRDPKRRIGSSFDFAIGEDGILEVKNVFGLKFRDEWIKNEDGSIEAPPHIELQVQHQLGLTGRKFAYIAALVSGNQVVIIRREPDQEIIGQLRESVASFWKKIERNEAPAPDFKRDAQFIARLYQASQAGKVFDASQSPRVTQLAVEYIEAANVEREAKAHKDSCKSEILTLIGDAEKAIGETFSISAGTVAGTRIEAYDRAPYRNFRINSRKPKP